MSDTGVLHTRSKTYGRVPSVLMHDTTITDGAIRLYAHLHWRFSNAQRPENQASIADALGVSEKAVSNRIKELEAKDWIVVIERAKDTITKKHMPPIYHVFEHQGQCRQFRARYTCQEGETIRQKAEHARARKSRVGVGGNPNMINQRNLSSEGIQQNSSSVGNQRNLSSDNVLYSGLPSITTNTTTAPTPYETIKNKWQSVVRGGMPTPNDLVGIQEDMKLYSHSWIMDALKSATPGRPFSWKYIQSILKTWKQNGKPGEAPRVKYITQVSTPHEDQRLALLMGQEYVPPVLQ